MNIIIIIVLKKVGLIMKLLMKEIQILLNSCKNYIIINRWY